MNRVTEMVKHLIIINVIFFAGTYLMAEMNGVAFTGSKFFEYFALFFPENPLFQPWQFLTSMFMHGGIMHIVFNMYGLWAFGSPLESMWGKYKFLFFYVAAGLGAGIIYTLVNYYQFNIVNDQLIAAGYTPEGIRTVLETGSAKGIDVTQSQFNNFFHVHNIPAVGASGAIYGILVAFGFKFPNSEMMLMFLPYPIKAKYFIPAILALDLFLGLSGKSLFGGSGTGIAHFAHLGGALVGYLLMLYFQRNQVNRWD